MTTKSQEMLKGNGVFPIFLFKFYPERQRLLKITQSYIPTSRPKSTSTWMPVILCKFVFWLISVTLLRKPKATFKKTLSLQEAYIKTRISYKKTLELSFDFITIPCNRSPVISFGLKDGAYYCYCAYVLRISRYSDFLSPMLTKTGIFLRGLKLSGESRS